MAHRVRKAVFPVAGLGTRFLPATKAMPKEMLTVVDRPLIQHVVDEAREAGIEHFIFVTGRNKGVIEDHFDRQFELELTLTERGKTADLELLSRDLPGPGSTSFTRQQSPLGLGHAIWCARELVGNEPFALLLPDVLVQAERSCLAQMIAAYDDLGERGNVIAVEEVPPERVHIHVQMGGGGYGRRAVPTSDYIVEALRAAIYDGQFADGEELNQVELAAYFKVSRVPIREALRQLQAEQLVRSVAHRRANPRRNIRPGVRSITPANHRASATFVALTSSSARRMQHRLSPGSR